MGDKSVETLCKKIEFLSILVTFPPFPPKQCWFFYFFDCTDHRAYTTLNWGAGGIRELTLEANKIEQMLKYRKVSFPKSVSTAFVAHCLEAIYANCGDFLFAHGCYVTSMSVEGNRMALDHSFTDSLIHSLTHSILINLFIKTGLNRFSYPSPA